MTRNRGIQIHSAGDVVGPGQFMSVFCTLKSRESITNIEIQEVYHL
jgi:hypothetical protein